MGIVLDAKPCPFCGSEIRHIGSWAKSFNQPRLYHEWQHVSDDMECWVRRSARIVASAPDDPTLQVEAIERWNRRASHPHLSQESK